MLQNRRFGASLAIYVDGSPPYVWVSKTIARICGSMQRSPMSNEIQTHVIDFYQNEAHAQSFTWEAQTRHLLDLISEAVAVKRVSLTRQG